MGAIEDQVQKLHTIVESLEARIKSLEERKFGSGSKTADEVRMILIGPPGAGTSIQWLTNVAIGSS